MSRPLFRACSRWLAGLSMLLSLVVIAACGGGVDASSSTAGYEICNADDLKVVLQAVPAAGGGGGGGGTATTLTVHYRRLNGDTSGWQLHTWGAGKDPGWNAGWNPVGNDSFGAIYEVPLNAASGNVGYLFHQGDTKDHGGADQSYTLAAGKNEIWRIEGDATTYTKNPLGSSAPDLTAVRVHYKRYDGAYDKWGVHIWGSSGLDVAGLKPGVAIDNWGNAVPFGDFNNASTTAAEVVFDIPVLNPKADASRTALEFIIHGRASAGGDANDKDGRNDNIRVSYAALTIRNQVGEIWLLQGDPTVYTSVPDPRLASTTDARAYWLNGQLLKFPKVDASGVFKLYHAANGQIQAVKDAKVAGADGALTLSVYGGAVPDAAAQRFKYVAPGVVLAVADADRSRLRDLHRGQLVLVQENADGLVQNASTAQVAGALDDLYGAAQGVDDLGVTVAGGSTGFKLWAPTAQKVTLCVYDRGDSRASAQQAMSFDATTGVWRHSLAGDQSGKYYRYAVEVFVRGVGVVRNLVTDPYSISLTTDSARSYIGNLASAALKPEGWDAHATPAKVARPTDMVIYELHVRDFSANDPTVSTANRGKYLAFTESNSNGMQHLKALAGAGLTDVHLLPVFDIATVPESGCAAVATGGAPDGEQQQADVMAVKDADCFNWGYDPWHFNAPEGSYASSAGDGARRIVEFRAMVQALHQAGLRVGMDVVYNHTTASGQNDKSVLDRVVPGYYHRLNASGAVEKSTCCDNTATENQMMAKLMSDSVLQWAREYRIDSFRFDLMGHQPRAVMEQLKNRVDAALGRSVQLIGEGWNFGEVADGARFVQASQLSLNGSGIGSFSDRARDHVRGGGPFDGGNSLVANQGYINGLWYDPNTLGGGRSKTDLMWSGDMIKVGLAGSIRGFTLTTHWDATLRLEQLDYNGQPAGYVLNPDEVVNYVENHDNQTLFDINAYKLPLATSREDRARVQILGAAINAFSQGIAYFHAGVDTLRSKSMDRNSYNSGDWFNRLDWSYQDNNFAVGLPPAADNADNWPLMKPRLADAGLKPTAAEIAWTRDAFRDLLKIRASTTLLRLRSGDDIRQRLHFHNTGSAQVPTVLAGHVDGNGYAGAGFRELLYLVNVDKVAQTVTLDALKGRSFVLHPVHTAAGAADRRAANDAKYNAASGAFVVPPRTAVVWVVN